MNTHLSRQMRAAMAWVEGTERPRPVPEGFDRRTLEALWSRGLIAWLQETGWQLPDEGRLAMKKGKQMISQRREP